MDEEVGNDRAILVAKRRTEVGRGTTLVPIGKPLQPQMQRQVCRQAVSEQAALDGHQRNSTSFRRPQNVRDGTNTDIY